MDLDLIKKANWLERFLLLGLLLYPVIALTNNSIFQRDILNTDLLFPFNPTNGWNEFFSDPGLWGNILAGLITIWALRLTLNKTNQSILLSLNDHYLKDLYEGLRAFQSLRHGFDIGIGSCDNYLKDRLAGKGPWGKNKLEMVISSIQINDKITGPEEALVTFAKSSCLDAIKKLDPTQPYQHDETIITAIRNICSHQKASAEKMIQGYENDIRQLKRKIFLD